MSRRRIAALALVFAAITAPAPAAERSPPAAGESIYLRGVTGSGAPVVGKREGGGVDTSGAQAACVNCHQRSGLGTREGNTFIPPVTGEYLYAPLEHDASQAPIAYVEGIHGNRTPYTDAALAKAIREGVDPQGRRFSVLMPRFELGDADMASLIEYLKKLTVRRVPGVTDAVLHFATVFTPDADRTVRGGVLDVLQHFVADKNAFPFKPSPSMRTSNRTAFAKSMYMAHRHWQLHVWDLTGAPQTWGAQLDRHLAEEPVYALLSGLGGSDWAPVHEFCERNAIPCLFPNVEVPVVADTDFYPVYFSKGVLLEAELLAQRLATAGGTTDPGTIVQIYRKGDSGARAAALLAARLKDRGLRIRDEVLPAGSAGHGIPAAVAAAADATSLVLWLRPADVAALGPPPAKAKAYLSGLLGGLEDAPLPAAWRPATLMAYPLDLPLQRGVRLDYPLGWFKFRHIPVVAIHAQADTYLACSLIADALNNHMADVISRPYLIEQLQGMIERRLMTGYYPRLTLAANQRFASKGGYFAHFADPSGPKLVADSEWTVP